MCLWLSFLGPLVEKNTAKVPIVYWNPENKSYHWQRKRMKDYMYYLERAADRLLTDRLDGFGAVLIEGPKWCGKTTTASLLANSCIIAI